MMAIAYAVLGAGMQGTAAAYDLAVHGDASEVRLADVSAGAARRSAERIDRLVGRKVCRPAAMDAGDEEAVRRSLEGVRAVLCAAPYSFAPGVARAALAAGCSFCDLGGNMRVGQEIRDMDARAREAGVTLVPDCGLAPGLSSTLAVHAMHEFDRTQEVHIRCGGLPRNPRGPLDYMLVFSIGGLTNEYTGECIFLREGVVTPVPALEEVEPFEMEGLPLCEAFTTSGGTSTCPETYRGEVREWTYKTVRYRGHHAKVRAMADLGLLDLAPVRLSDGRSVVPRDVFHACAAPRLTMTGEEDLVTLRVSATGEKGGRRGTVHVELLEYGDARTGFTAMERMTGFPAAMVAIAMARGETRPGAIPLERAIEPAPYVADLEKRGIQVRKRWD